MSGKPSRRRAAAIFCALFVLASLFSAFAAQGSARQRPTVALVLGGGSSRGLSHIGLLKAFEEEGIPVDYIVGTSMGSVVAGLYAAGLGAHNLEYMVHHMRPEHLFAPSLPLGGGLIDSRRFEILLDELTAGISFAEAPIPFYTVVINLLTGEEETVHEGRLSRGILASMSVPGVFPPVQIGENYYIDGGLRNLTPVTVARQTGADVVVAVDVRRTVENIDYDALSSNLQLTLMLLLAQDTDEELERADLVIEPRVDSGSYMDYERMDHFIAEGYRAAKEMAPRLKETLRQLQPDMQFVPRTQGPNTAEFARLMAGATAAYEKQTGPSLRRLDGGVAFVSGGNAASELRLSWPLGRQGGGPPLFGAVVAAWRERTFQPALGVGLGDCNRLCAAVFGRNDGGQRWRGAVGWQGRWAGVLRHDGEFVPAGGAADEPAGWRLRLRWPGFVPVEQGNEWLLSALQDPGGHFGSSAGGLQLEATWRRLFAGRRADVLEVMRTTAAWYVGAGARFDGKDNSVSPVAEIGLALEGRLFGLYPLQSRIGLRYRGGSDEWTLSWGVGQWTSP